MLDLFNKLTLVARRITSFYYYIDAKGTYRLLPSY